jgi:hypothetical protein
MYILIPLLLLVVVTLFYVATKEGLEDKKPLGNPNLDKKAIQVDPAKNSVELPNHVSGIVSEDLDIGGNLNLLNDNKIEFGKGDKTKGPASGTIQYKNDFLNIIGAGKDGDKSKIKLWDDVEVGSLLITGTQTVNNTQKLLAGQEVAGISSYKGKVNINPTETDRRNMVDLSIGDELTGFRKGDKTVSFTGDTNEVGGFDKDRVFVNRDTQLEFGRGTQKEANAGTIAYQKSYAPDSLSIVGAGAASTGRKIKLFDDVDVVGKLTVNGGEITSEKGPQFSVGNEIEFAKGTTKEQNAGKINYKIHGGESLDIVGASPGVKTSWDKDRRVHIYDNAMVYQDLEVGRNLNVGGAIKVGNWFIYEDDQGMLRFASPDNKFKGENNGTAPKVPATSASLHRKWPWETNQNGIGILWDGNAWLTRDSWSGWISEGIRFGDQYTPGKKWTKTDQWNLAIEGRDKANSVSTTATNAQTAVGEVRTIATNAQTAANDARTAANNSFNKNMIRQGYAANPGHTGRVTFAPFVGVDKRNITVICTPESWSKGRDWWHYVSVHVEKDGIELDGFSYNMTIRMDGSSSTWRSGWGEGFYWIAIAR